MDAEDMVQETYLRYQTTPSETIHSLKAYRDHGQLARRKREQYLGPWLPEPIVTTDAPELAWVEKRVDECEPISLAFLVILEQLQPLERAVLPGKVRQPVSNEKKPIPGFVRRLIKR